MAEDWKEQVANPWDGKNSGDSDKGLNGKIVSNVDNQDDNELSVSSLVGQTNSSILSSFGVTKSGTSSNEIPGDRSSLQSGLESLKDSKYSKSINMLAKVGTYNTLDNLFGTAGGLLVGALGSDTISNIFEGYSSSGMTGSSLASTTGTAYTLLTKLASGAAYDSMPTVSDLVKLNTVNVYTMYTGKPGLTVRYSKSNTEKLNYVTGHGSDGTLDGSSTTTSTVEKVLSSVRSVYSTYKKYLDIRQLLMLALLPNLNN